MRQLVKSAGLFAVVGVSLTLAVTAVGADVIGRQPDASNLVGFLVEPCPLPLPKDRHPPGTASVQASPLRGVSPVLQVKVVNPPAAESGYQCPIDRAGA